MGERDVCCVLQAEAAATSLGGYIYIFGGLSFGHVLDQAAPAEVSARVWATPQRVARLYIKYSIYIYIFVVIFKMY